MKPVYFITGWFFFFVGAVGVVLPVLPTTPFMLLALWAFSKSSVRFHNWLYSHRVFGPPLQQWELCRVIPLSAKILSTSMMAASFVYLLLYRDMHVSILITVAVVMLYAMWFVLTKPSSPLGDAVVAQTDKNPL